eukprot:gene9058-16704_t
MTMQCRSILLKVISIFGVVSSLSIHDPRLSPGHMKPLGTGRPKFPVEALTAYPSPQEFFDNYVDKKRPFIIYGAAKSSPAFTKWTHAYFKGNPEIANMHVSVDKDKKELNNISDYRHMKFGKFLDRFQSEEMYLVDGVKKQLQVDILLPSPLRCKETREHLKDTAIWYSSGGTKSLFSLTFRDEIVCVLRGRNEYLMVPYMNYRDRFTEIKDEAGIRGIDVDSVDFGKYPQMEDIEWMSATLDEGDCMYLPYKWANQINSFAGKTKESLFITFSFNHVHDHKPKQCSIDPSEATLDKYQFSHLEDEEKARKEADLIRKHKHGNQTNAHNHDAEEEDDDHHHDGESEDESNEDEGLLYLNKFKSFLKKRESKTVNFQQFIQDIKASDIFDEDLAPFSLPNSFEKITREIFDIVDVDKDSLLSYNDFKAIRNSKRFQEILSDLDWKVRNWSGYLDDYLESHHHGKSNEQFDVERKARELRKKLSVHDPMEL